MKMAVLAVGVFDVAVAMTHRCGGQDGDRILAYDVHELAPPPGELFAVHREP